jgi:hypothetical protein
MPLEPVALGSDDHIGSHRSRTGSGRPGLTINFTDTESTGTEGSEVMRDAEAGDRNPGFLGSLVDRIAWFRGHSLAVYIELHRFLLRSIRLKFVKSSGRQVIKSSSQKGFKSQDLSRPRDLMTF